MAFLIIKFFWLLLTGSEAILSRDPSISPPVSLFMRFPSLKMNLQCLSIIFSYFASLAFSTTFSTTTFYIVLLHLSALLCDQKSRSPNTIAVFFKTLSLNPHPLGIFFRPGPGQPSDGWALGLGGLSGNFHG